MLDASRARRWRKRVTGRPEELRRPPPNRARRSRTEETAPSTEEAAARTAQACAKMEIPKESLRASP
jgi:hypothetical protein